MGALARLCLSLVVVCTSFTIGDIINSELKYQYNGYRARRDKRNMDEIPEKVCLDDTKDVVVLKES